MQPLKFKISSHHASSEILICLKDRDQLFPISGFPRILQQEDSTRGMSLSDSSSNGRCFFAKRPIRMTLFDLYSLIFNNALATMVSPICSIFPFICLLYLATCRLAAISEVLNPGLVRTMFNVRACRLHPTFFAVAVWLIPLHSYSRTAAW